MKTEFENYCLKNRMKQLDLNMPFCKVFGAPLSKFFPKVLLGFDVIAFEAWIHPNENQSTYEAIEAKFGQEGVDIIKQLIA